MEIVDANGDKPYVIYPSTEAYIKLYTDNQTGYDISSVTINGTLYTEFVEKKQRVYKSKVDLIK